MEYGGVRGAEVLPRDAVRGRGRRRRHRHGERQSRLGATGHLREALREYADLPSAEFQYPPSEGLLELREAIAERRNVDADRVVVTNGTGEANYLAIARAFERDAGDEALLMDPVYPYYPGKTDMLGGESTLVPTERDGGLDVDAIREAASEDTALIVLNTPNNPTGAVYDLDAVREVVAVADAVDASSWSTRCTTTSI